MSSTSFHRTSASRASLVLAILSGVAAVTIAAWGIVILGAH